MCNLMLDGEQDIPDDLREARAWGFESVDEYLTAMKKENNMRLIIAGGRTFNNLGLLSQQADKFVNGLLPITVISGTARGADQLGERWAQIRRYDIERFPAQWDIYGKSAGYKRNEQMANTATHLLAFWDGQSRGTKHMIDIARTHNLEVRVITY